MIWLSSFLIWLSGHNSVLFQSLESETETGAPVFNEIAFFRQGNQDIWMMKQSQHGLNLDHSLWDRLAIVVDRDSEPKTAKFYQLAPGELNDLDLSKAVPLKARCFACHSSGPRAIRENSNLGFTSQLQLSIWNTQIRLYGAIQSSAQEFPDQGIPFRSRMNVMKKPLGLTSCKKCHWSQGVRSPLTMEQLGTSYFLMKNHLMPPFPFSANSGELEKLRRFISD